MVGYIDNGAATTPPDHRRSVRVVSIACGYGEATTRWIPAQHARDPQYGAGDNATGTAAHIEHGQTGEEIKTRNNNSHHHRFFGYVVVVTAGLFGGQCTADTHRGYQRMARLRGVNMGRGWAALNDQHAWRYHQRLLASPLVGQTLLSASKNFKLNFDSSGGTGLTTIRRLP